MSAPASLPLSPTQYASQRGFRNAQMPRRAEEAMAREREHRERLAREQRTQEGHTEPASGWRGVEERTDGAGGHGLGGSHQRSESIKRDEPTFHSPADGPSGSATSRSRALGPPNPLQLGAVPAAHIASPSESHSTAHEPLESAHTHAGQDVHIPPSLGESAPVSASPSGELAQANGDGRGSTSWEDPLASASASASEGGHAGKMRSRYAVGTPRMQGRTMSEEQGARDDAYTTREAQRGGPPAHQAFSDSLGKSSNASNPFADKSGVPHGGFDRDGDIDTRRSSASAHPRRMRNYKHLRAQPLQDTHYLLSGRLMTGGDSPIPFLLSLVLVLGLGGLWIGATGVWMWRDGLGAGGRGAGGKAAVVVFGYLLGIVISSMLATALRDPGIIPRNLDLYPPTSRSLSTGSLNPLTREVRVRNGSVPIKYCETCKVYRPPRSSHCRLCGNCVEGIDHHCTYLHACVGRRNYTSFIIFLVSTTLGVIYTVVFSALHFSILCSRERISFREALARSPASAVSFGLGVIILAPVAALLGYHLRLMFLHSTTIEQIRSSASKSLMPTSRPQANPFAYGSFWRNVAHSLCRPQYPSWIDPHGFAEEDTRQPNSGEKGRFGIASRVDVRTSGGTSRFGSLRT